MKVHIGKYPKNPFKERKVDVKIDKYDYWNLDSTLAHIIVPALKQFRANINSIPGDFSAKLHNESYSQLSFDFINETYKEAEEIVFNQWKETVDKMIWSFEQILADDNEEQYIIDKKVYQIYRERIQEGLDLFAKYYTALWD